VKKSASPAVKNRPTIFFFFFRFSCARAFLILPGFWFFFFRTFTSLDFLQTFSMAFEGESHERSSSLRLLRLDLRPQSARQKPALLQRKRPDNRTFAGRFDRGMIVPEVTEMLRVQPDL
jgi:hypothetical protein